MPTSKVPPVETGRADLQLVALWTKKLDGARSGAWLNKSLRLGVDCLLGFNNPLAVTTSV